MTTPTLEELAAQLKTCHEVLNRLKGFLASQVHTDPRVKKYLDLINGAIGKPRKESR